ncbi:hypothetical protein ALP65_04611 [Pseudomonas aeruginosa]|uniref:Uncharacterized protein n=1 Tax=Pseudomonas aeruginosa TaxID=287 RepID=A0A3M5DBK2_PSEAI|nr:hypothetical protein ALP65_04611 [Pseudomonas aeruginosa]
MADAADAEGFHLGQLARIEDEALLPHALVEVGEAVARIARRVEGNDDRRLDFRRQEAAETEPGHLAEQRFAIARVAPLARRQAALLFVLAERFVQGGDHMGRRGEAPLPGLAHIGVLVLQVHGQGVAVAGAGFQGGAAGEDEAHPGDALQALAGGGDQGIERNFPGIDPDRPEGAHGIDDQALAVTLDDLGDGLERIEDAGAGLAVDQRHMADRRIGGQQTLDVSGGGRHVLFGLEGAEGPLQNLADLRQALAVGTVDQHQDLAVARHQGADRRFHGEGAAALQRYAGVAAFAADDLQQALADAGGEFVEIAVPGAPVDHHRPTGTVGGGQRTGGQQDGCAFGSAHAHFLCGNRPKKPDRASRSGRSFRAGVPGKPGDIR